MESIGIIIPAFNEEEAIKNVIDDIPKENVQEIVVVNNNSSDRTEEIAKSAGVTVLKETKRGYGNACLAGIAHFRNKSSNEQPGIIVFLDADYSDHPEEMTQLVNPILEGEYDLVIGSRVLGNREKGAMLPQAILGNMIATFLIRLIYNFRFTDLGPFRAIRFNKLLELDMQDRTFGWTVEMQVKALKHGMECREVPVSYRKRIGVSKITGTIEGTIKAGYKIIWTIFKYM
ncbi:MAG: glycosyltransferase family 2 protein [Bacteroidia bacterium]|nr:glycosyltransferase family 2 protein [Bacteroidia bacterium]